MQEGPMKITIEGASEEFARELVALAAQHADVTVTTIDAAWTTDRAERFLRSLPSAARRLAEMVIVDGDGYIDAEQLRAVLGRLNGASIALTRALPRGVRKGWWPEGTTAPIRPVSDPDNPSWHQNIAYRMDQAIVPVFREALTRIIATKRAAEAAGLISGGPGKTSSAVTITAPGVDFVDLDGGSGAVGGDQDEEERR
jgi:hypothetical protein